MTEQKPQTGTQSIERAFDILRVVAAGPAGGMRLKDIAEETGLYGPTAHRILTTLQTGGLIERRRDSALYVIGSELALLGLGSSFRRFRELAAPTLRNLSDEVGDAVFLSVRSDLDTVCADRKIGSYPIQVLTIEIGSRRPLGISANGVAMLSRMSRPEATDILLRNSGRLEGYKTPIDVIEGRIDEARKRGYVHISQAIVRGTSALAMPVCDAAGRPLAAVSTIAVSSRQSQRRVPKLVSLLRTAADEVAAAVSRPSARAAHLRE
jgi:DNA-binding IclR family transcriptional regulator